jgi:hypothetical protein
MGSYTDVWQFATDVGYWHKADMLNALTNVRFWG